MFDMLPFPNITATNAEEQAVQTNNYLIQLKESLEFILTNISVDNLSQELITTINSLGAQVKKNQTDRDEEMQQVTNRILTASDVVNSSAYQADLDARDARIQEAHESDISAVNESIQAVSEAHSADKEALESQIQDLASSHQTDMDSVEQKIEAVSSRILTASDVVNSSEMQGELDAMESEVQANLEAKLPTASEVLASLKLTVNYETGHLEY